MIMEGQSGHLDVEEGYLLTQLEDKRKHEEIVRKYQGKHNTHLLHKAMISGIVSFC